MGISEQDGIYDVSPGTGARLSDLAVTSKAAHSLACRIIEQNLANGAPVPEPLLSIASGEIPPPRRRGKTGAENGARDLIFKIMAVHLQDEFDVPLSRNDISAENRYAISACEIIHDAFRENNLAVPDVRSIEKAIRRCN